MNKIAIDILLVEDNPQDVKLALHAFRKNNLANNIQVARDGAEALDFLFGTGPFEGRDVSQRPKVILLDLKLPLVNGIEVLERLRADPRTRTIPIVMLTSSAEEPDIAKCYQLGVNSYIVKPVDFDQFLEVSRQLGFYWLMTNPTAHLLSRALEHAGGATRDSRGEERNMNKQLRILILEDRPSDAKLMVLELLRAGFDPQWRRVDTEEDYLAELALAPDIILSDYNLPHFSAPRALGLLSERGLDIPFIIVSGSIGEEVAVQAIQQGASDYLLKDRLGRLGSAVSQALKERQLRDEKRRAELALRESQERFRLVVESAPNGMVMIDRNGAIVFVNVLTEKLFGYPRAELLGQPLELLVPERSRAKHPDLRRGFFATPSARSMGEGRELYGRRKGGSEFPVNISLSPIETPEGLLVLSTIVDITERKQLEEQYRHAQKMEAVGKLAGGVAHDFNNLLTVIMGYSEIQLRTLRPEDPLRVPFNEIRKAGEQAASLTRQLLVFSRKQVLMPVVLDLNAILTAMEKMLCRLIGEDVALTVLQGKSLWRVKADPGQMEQVVMNLVVNARDAMPLGGKLLLETKNVELEDGYVQTHTQAKAGEHVLLAISDAGCGMDAAVKARIFEPFFTTKDPGKGTGLGLATVYGIVRQSGGHIEVYSEVGQGTTFKIYLPRDRGGDTAAPSARAAQPARGGTETILLVEDEEGVRALAKTVLQRNGYTIIDAKTGGQALSIGAAHSEPIALLITDVVMPNLSGRQLAERLALLQPNMAVLYISGYTDDAIIHHGVLEAGTPFLQKPFTPDSLARKVREVLDEAQRRLT